jgi:DNA repair protein RadA/Sms
MAKPSSYYVCQSCGWKTQRWVGKCGSCGEWDSLVEEFSSPIKEAWGSVPRLVNLGGEAPRPLSGIDLTKDIRTLAGIEEFDRVLGGGVVKGSAVVIGGPPGIGKSTLLIQVCHNISLRGHKVLYITAEESLSQVRLRAERLGISGSGLLLAVETSLESILGHIQSIRPTLVVVDSIQMIYKPGIGSAPGTLSQVSQCANELIYAAKDTGSALFLVGHVTKQGMLAGPKVLEHMADTVLYFEGEKSRPFRVLRVVKNRFGPTNEVAIFEMGEKGLQGVDNPSRFFLSSHKFGSSGTATISCMEGTRAMLLEVQALVTRSNFGTPERRVSGVDYNRVSMLIAVLEKRLGLHMDKQDVFVNAVGGMCVDEPAADLGIAMGMASSLKDRPIPPQIVLVGEVGLAGEVRGVSYIDTRLQEAARQGFNKALIPEDNSKGLERFKGLELVRVSHLTDALRNLGG